jgi:hypothetical protein
MKSYSDIENHIKGKSVAIVGNAQSILQKEDGLFIDAYDVVIRMNFGYTFAPHLNRFVAPKYLGTKTDVVTAGNALNILNEMNRYPGAKFLVHMSGGNRNETIDKKQNKFHLYPIEYWESLKNVLTARPSTGMMVFDMVEKSNPRHVAMFGFDWKHTPTYYNDGKAGRQKEEPNKPIGPHNWVMERNYIIGKCKKMNWDIV